MSIDFERNLDNFLFFGGEMPNLAQGVQEVPLPDGFYYCTDCGMVTNYWKPGTTCAGCEARGERQQEDEHDEN